MPNKEDINFDWRYSADFKEEYISPSFDDTNFANVNIPHTNIETPYNNFDEKMYQFVSTYKKKILIKKLSADERIYIKFDAIMTYAKVYLNGQFIGDHKGGYTPFRLDLTDFAIIDSLNDLTVVVDSHEKEEIPPFGFVVDYLSYGGIYREVSLEYCHQIHIGTAGVKTKNVLSEKPELEIDLYIQNQNQRKADLKVEFALIFEEDVSNSFSKSIRLTGDRTEKISLNKTVENIHLWDLEHPNLYFLEISLFHGDRCIDSYSVRFGFREALFTKKGFLLNGKKLKILGLNRHQSFPYVGYAMPKSAQYKDAEILKYELGVNTVRLSHYPQSDHFMNRCDEIGLLVLDEIPGWQHIGDESWQRIALQNVQEMILKDMNHPSVIIWGIRINESSENPEFYQKTNFLAHSLDQTRQTGGVRNIKKSPLLEDVYTYNDFFHNGTNQGLERKRAVTQNRNPYLITEHNGHMFPTKKFDDESHRIEQAKRHLKVINAMKKDDFIAGAIGWCMFDYNTHKEFGSGDKICYHGVMDMFRIPKDAAYVYLSQQKRTPMMHVASSLNIGEYKGSMLEDIYIFTNCDFIKVYKNGSYINSFYPQRDTYASVDHPPIIVDDLIGDAIEKNERFSPGDARIIKKILIHISKNGVKLNVLQILQMGWIFLKYKMNQHQAQDLYTKYFGGWGAASVDYLFEGFINDSPVIKVHKSQVFTPHLEALADSKVLKEGATYDVSRVVLHLLDENNNPIVYAHDTLILTAEGPIEIIGPTRLSLIGGSVAFWIKSIGKSGTASVKIESHRFGQIEKTFKVLKED